MVGEMSVRGNVLVGKCPVGKCPVGELSVRGNVRRGSVSRGFVLGEVSGRETVLQSFRTLSNICHTPGSFRYFPKAFYKTEVQEKEDNKDESHIGKPIRKNPSN